MGIVVALLAISGYGLYIHRLVKCPFESSLLLVCASLICLVYLSGLFGCLQIAAQILLGIGVMLFLADVLLRWRSGTIVKGISPGVFFLLLSTAGLWILTRSEAYSYLMTVDDYGTWARMSKIIASNNRLIIPTDAISFQDYPPGMALFDYLFLQFGEFSENRAMFSHGIFIIASFAQLFSVIPNNINRYVLFGVNIFIYALINALIWYFETGLHTLCVDLILCVVFGIASFGYLAGRQNGRLASIIRIAPLVAVLPLIKLIGILFSSVIVGIIIFDVLFGSISGREKIKLFFAALFLMALCFFTYVSWGTHVKNMGLHTALSTKAITPDNVIKAFIPASASEVQKTIIDNFTRRVFPLPRNPYYWLILCLLFLWIIWRTGKDYNPWERTIPFAVLFVGFYAYLFVLLILYLFSFGSYEGQHLVSFDRYENTYLVGMIIVFFGVSLSQYFKNKQDRTTTISYIAICFIAMLPNSEKGLLDVSNAMVGWGGNRDVESIVQYSKVIEKVTPPNSHVYFIWQGGSNGEGEIFNYGILPRTNNRSCASVGEPYLRPNISDVWTCPMTPSEFEQKLMDYDYLFIARADKKFIGRFLPQFGFDNVQDGSLFHVLKEMGHVKLKKISLESGQRLR